MKTVMKKTVFIFKFIYALILMPVLMTFIIKKGPDKKRTLTLFEFCM